MKGKSFVTLSVFVALFLMAGVYALFGINVNSSYAVSNPNNILTDNGVYAIGLPLTDISINSSICPYGNFVNLTSYCKHTSTGINITGWEIVTFNKTFAYNVTIKAANFGINCGPAFCSRATKSLVFVQDYVVNGSNAWTYVGSLSNAANVTSTKSFTVNSNVSRILVARGSEPSDWTDPSWDYVKIN